MQAGVFGDIPMCGSLCWIRNEAVSTSCSAPHAPLAETGWSLLHPVLPGPRSCRPRAWRACFATWQMSAQPARPFLVSLICPPNSPFPPALSLMHDFSEPSAQTPMCFCACKHAHTSAYSAVCHVCMDVHACKQVSVPVFRQIFLWAPMLPFLGGPNLQPRACTGKN